MCGVYFRYCKKINCELDHDLIDQKQFSLITHRGPDEQIIEKISDKITIGFSRLSIRSIKKGGQPYFHDSKYTLFNGELYNENEIRNEVIKVRPDLTFALPDGDMQLLGLWLAVGGENAIKIVEGMFAGIIFDQQSNKVLLIRDRFGEKPLFYAIKDNHLFISSEARFSEITSGINIKILDLVRGFYDQEKVDMVQEVKPGHIICFDLESFDMKVNKYWNWGMLRKMTKKFNYELEFNEIFENAVEQTLISDVPIATFLSSGLDSTAVNIAAAKILDHKITAFTFKMPEASYDESLLASKISKHLEIDHEVIDLEPEYIAANINSVISAMDVPIFDTSSIPYFFLSKEVAKSHKVALSGDGSDELFRGYYLYNQISLLRNIACFPDFAIKLVLKLLLGVNSQNTYTNLRFKAERINSHLDSNIDLLITALSPLAGTQLFTEATKYIDKQSLVELRPKKIDFNSIDFYYRENIFPKLYLRKADRMSMANGIEIRNPMLNTNIVNFALSYEKLHPRSHGKKFIYEYCQSFLPASFLQKSKKGFSFPISVLMQYLEYPDWQMPFLKNEERAILKIWDNATKGNINCGITIWSLLVANDFYKRQMLSVK